jgi:predicted enzyme related to lactoylglutathione lyase
MPATITPVVVSRDVERLRTFYTELLGAQEAERVPPDGPVFYLGLRLAESALGLVQNKSVDPSAPARILLSIEVADVDATLARVDALGGHAPDPAHDMAWGQRVAHIRDPDGNPVNLTQTIAE